MTWMLLILGGLMTGTSIDLFERGAAPWVVINDGVMGGRSTGSVNWRDNTLVFAGELSLENNGGFASIRQPLAQGLAGMSAVRLSVRGDGRTYQLRLRHGRQFDGVAWRARFVAPAQWTDVTLPLEDFQPGFRGRDVPGAGPVRPAEVGQVGILLGDGNPGPFHLEVRLLTAVPAP